MAKPGLLDRLVQFRRYAEVDDGFGMTQIWADHGPAIWAAKTDVSDGERWRAGEVAASITTRFVVRWSAFSADLTPRDRLVCEGLTYEVTGIKEGDGRRRWLEITAAARADVATPPVSLSAPAIAGTAQAGETLTATAGAWGGSPVPDLAFEWLADGAAIAGASGDAYVLTGDDIGAAISVRVTATNSAGAATADSAPTGAVTP